MTQYRAQSNPIQSHSSSSNLDSSQSSSSGIPSEGNLTRKVERETAKIPSMGYLSLAIGSMAISAGLAMFAKKKEYANFVGLWAPSFLLIGIYNKLVKLEGSDFSDKQNAGFSKSDRSSEMRGSDTRSSEMRTGSGLSSLSGS